MSSPYFSIRDFQEVAEIKGETIELQTPVTQEQNYEFGLMGGHSTQKLTIKTILQDQRESTVIRGGKILAGALTATFADPSVPNPLPKDAWFVYQGIKYLAEEQTPVMVQGQVVVRKVKLTRDPQVRSDYTSGLQQGR